MIRLAAAVAIGLALVVAAIVRLRRASELAPLPQFDFDDWASENGWHGGVI